MLLHHRTQGKGFPLLILHGLFGSMDNWRSLAPKLARQFKVITVDLPNHGRSPAEKSFNYPSLARNLIAFMDQQAIPAATFLGHSLGGKVAMQCALDFPKRVQRLLVIDIALRAYAPEHLFIFRALRALNLAAYESRREIYRALQGALPNPAVRQFLLMNLEKAEQGYRWRIDLENLQQNYPAICAAVKGKGPYLGPALFLKGASSDYIKDEDEGEILAWFPEAELISIPRAGHWVQTDAPEAFLNAALEFLKEESVSKDRR